MRLPFLLVTCLSFVTLNAVEIATQPTYNVGENITVNLTNMEGLNQDWVGIYPSASGNEWENVLRWSWTGDVQNANIILNGLEAVGNYQARIFYNNSFNVEASSSFDVQAVQLNTTLTTNKESYNADEEIVVNFSNMQAINHDWIGIYSAGSSNDWENVVRWSWTQDVNNGQVTFPPLPAGNYDARAFFNNSFNTEATDTFSVQAVALNTTVSTSQDSYLEGESVIVNFSGLLAQGQDWIGIYTAGSSNDWENVVNWAWTENVHEGQKTFDGIAIGNYDVRVFFNNSFEVEASAPFTVAPNFIPPTIYEDAEDGTTLGWSSNGEAGEVENRENPEQDGLNDSSRSIYAHVRWNGYQLLSSYSLGLEDGSKWNNTNQTVLKLDQKTSGTACFLIGVGVDTLEGRRNMYWDVWLAHQGLPAQRKVYDNNFVTLVYPLNEDYRRRHDWKAIEFDLNEQLKILEPNNKITKVIGFFCSGGDYLDNIRLESAE